MGSGLDRMWHTLLCGFNLYLLVSWKPSLRTIFIGVRCFCWWCNSGGGVSVGVRSGVSGGVVFGSVRVVV